MRREVFFPLSSLWWERDVAAVVGALNSVPGEGGGYARRPHSAGGLVWSAGWISFCCRAKGACHDCRNDAVRFRPAGAGAAAERFGDGQADVCWASALTGPPCGVGAPSVRGTSREARPSWCTRWVAGVLYQRVQRRALVVVQRRNAAGGCGGLAPCAGESLRGGTPSHVAGPEERFLFRIIQSYTKRSARTDQGQTLAGAPVQPPAAFCIRSNYTVGAPAAISRRNGPRVIKSARAGNAVAVAPARLCGTGGRSASPTGVDVGTGGRLRPAARPGRLRGAFCFWQLPAIVAAAGRCRSRRRSGHVDKTGTESGHMAGTSAGAVGVCTAGRKF